MSKINHLTVLKYLINFFDCRQKHGMKINIERVCPVRNREIFVRFSCNTKVFWKRLRPYDFRLCLSIKICYLLFTWIQYKNERSSYNIVGYVRDKCKSICPVHNRMICSKHIYLIIYGLMDQRRMIVSKINHLIVLKYLIIFFVCRHKYGMKIIIERAFSSM